MVSGPVKLTARGLMVFHLFATIGWTLLIVPSLLWWKESVPWVVAMSVWANVAGHFSAWQAARIETLHEDASGG